MSKRQLIVLWVTVGLIGAMCLYPPWQVTRYLGPGGTWVSAGYAPLFSPPKMSRIDPYRLTAQVIPTALVSGLLVFTMRRRKPRPEDAE